MLYIKISKFETCNFGPLYVTRNVNFLILATSRDITTSKGNENNFAGKRIMEV